MDNCASGRENNLPVRLSTWTKQKNDMKQAAIRSGKIFQITYEKGTEHWFCRLCACRVVGDTKQHANSKRHMSTLAHFDKYLDLDRLNQNEDVSIHKEEPMSVDSEDAVPSRLDDFSPVAKLQEKLDEIKVGPLVGLEYLLELQDRIPAKEPSYLCILCNNPSDSRKALIHLSSFNHITLYLLKHFPRTYRALAPYMTDKRYKRNWNITLEKVAEGIEKKFGRLKPFPVDKDKFKQDRVQYLTRISEGRHFSELCAYTFKELTGYTFEEFVVRESKSFEDEKSSKRPSTGNHDGASTVKKPFRKYSPSRRNRSPVNRERRLSYRKQVSASSHKSRSRSRSPRSRNFKRTSPSSRTRNNRDGHGRNSYEGRVSPKKEKNRNDEEFEKLARVVEVSVKNSLKYHQKNPEKHPRYNEEWKKFWNRRRNELERQGVDVEKHDFKSEWITFWGKRLEDLHSSELKYKMDALRRRADQDLEQEKEVVNNSDRGPVKSRDMSYNSREKEIDRRHQDKAWERENAHRASLDEYHRPSHVMSDEEEVDVGEINVVDVFRILTALEEWLGSLGPKIIDLLSQALSMEKKEGNSSENLLDNEINYVLLETIKEKLKGHLLAGLIDMIEAKAIKKAIKKINGLLRLANQRKSQREKLKIKSSTVIAIGNIDRNAIAKRIANALVLQGKTNVSQAELEQLINTVVAMAEASKSNNIPMTMANFLEQIPGSILESNQPLTTETGDKIIIPTSVKKDAIKKLMELLMPDQENDSQKLENLSDSDLQTLIQNFKDLSAEEQRNLIEFLRKLEDLEPERAEKLWQFVHLEDLLGINENIQKSEDQNSSFSGKPEMNPILNDVEPIESDEEEEENENEEKEETNESPSPKIHIDSEEEDYTIEDVVKTVSKNVKEKELENKIKSDNAKKSELALLSAKNIMSCLMNNLNRVNTSENNVDSLGLSTPSTSQPNLSTNTSDFAKTFGDINMASLVSIVSSVKNLSGGETADRSITSSFPERQDESGTPFFSASQNILDGSISGVVKPNERMMEDSQMPCEPPKPDDLYFREGPERSFGDLPARPDDILGRVPPTKLDNISFGEVPGRLDNRSFGEVPPRIDDMSFGRIFPQPDDRSFERAPGYKPFEEVPPRLEDRPFDGVPTRPFGEVPSRTDSRSFREVSPMGNEKFFGKTSSMLDKKPFEVGFPRPGDRPFMGAPSRLDDRPFMREQSSLHGGGPLTGGRSFSAGFPGPVDRFSGGAPPKLDDRPFGGTLSRINDRPFRAELSRMDDGPFKAGLPMADGGSFRKAPPKLIDRPFGAGSTRIDDRPFGEALSRLHDRPFERASSRLDGIGRLFKGDPLTPLEDVSLRLDNRPMSGGGTRPFAGGLERPYSGKLGLTEEKPFSLGYGKPYTSRSYKTEDEFPSRSSGPGHGRIEENRFGFGTLENRSWSLGDRHFSSGTEERPFSAVPDRTKGLGKSDRSFVDRDFYRKGFPRSNMEHHSQFSDVPCQPPNVPDQVSRINNFKDFW